MKWEYFLTCLTGIITHPKEVIDLLQAAQFKFFHFFIALTLSTSDTPV